MEFFDNSLEELQSYLPLWWRKDDPSAELYKWVLTLAQQLDGTAQAFETAYNNAILTRADYPSLFAEWAWLLGMESERLPPTVQGLLAYIQSRMQEDGTRPSLVRTLNALIATTLNLTGIQLLFGGHYRDAVLDPGVGPTGGLVSYWRLGETPVAGSQAAIILADSPVSYYRLGEASGTVAADSADSNPGTYQGGTLAAAGPLPSDGGTAVTDNGTTDYVNVPDAPNLRLSAAFTFEAWVKPTDFVSNQPVVTKSDVGADRAYEFILNTSRQLEFASTEGAGAVGIAGTGLVVAGVWTHVAMTFNGTRWRTYINGVLDREVSGFIIPTTAANLQPVRIGARGGERFKGSLAHVAVYNTELTPAKIAAHANGGAPAADAANPAPPGPSAIMPQAANPGAYIGGITLAAAGALPSDPNTAATFDGATGYVNVPDAAALRLAGDLTFEAWVKPTDYANYNMILSKYGASDVAPFEWRLELTNGRTALLVGNGGSNTGVLGTTAPAVGVWSHIVVVVSGNTVTHYLNGVANGSGSIAGQARVDAGNPLTLGARRNQPYFFKGGIDEVSIYNIALSAAQIKLRYEAGNGGAFVFPSDGSGIRPLFQSTSVPQPDIVFPPDGSPLLMGSNGLLFDAAGAGLGFDPAGAGLTFPPSADLVFGTGASPWFLVEESTPNVNQFRVTSKSYLAFDRAAVTRAMERFRLAHMLPAIYQEVNY